MLVLHQPYIRNDRERQEGSIREIKSRDFVMHTSDWLICLQEPKHVQQTVTHQFYML